MNTQPRFWLKVTPEYVIDNFEELLKYVSEYDYSQPEDDDSDFNQTVDCLTQVAFKLLDDVAGCSAESDVVWDVDIDKGIRMIAAAVISEHKRGNLPHDLILGLVRVLLLTCNMPYSNLLHFIPIISACAMRAEIKHMPLRYSVIEASKYSDATLCARMGDFRFQFPDVEGAVAEGLGSVVFTAENPYMVPMNAIDLKRKYPKLRQEIQIECGICFMDTNVKRHVNTIEHLEELFPRLLSSLDAVKPSVIPVLKKYKPGDRLDVRIVYRSGIKIVCESIDPEYEKVRGNIYIDRGIYVIPREQVIAQLEPGNILPAVLNDADSGFTLFNLDHEEDFEFLSSYIEHYQGEPLRAMRLGNYSVGTQWMSEVGIVVNILHQCESYIRLNEHSHQGACVRIRIKNHTIDSKGNLVVNGEFLPETEQTCADVDSYIFREEAGSSLIRHYKDYISDGAVLGVDDNQPKFEWALPGAAEALGLLVLRMTKSDKSCTTFERMSRMALSALIMKSVARLTDRDIARREFDYHKAIAAFAMGENPRSLSFRPSELVAGLPSTAVESRIVEVLGNYVEHKYELPVSANLLGERFSLVEELVNASNALIGKIDASEISCIKKHIAVNLGVSDLFRDVAGDKTYYGRENDTLEFKISCVCPPENMRTGSERADIDVQRFNILKPICAMLNSPSGGELLVGVDDNGYACGIDNDIAVLFRNRMISEPNVDRLRTYIKNQIDSAFITNDASARGNAITAGNLTVNIEESSDHHTVLRFKVNPYPYDVVRIAPEFTLEGYHDVYFRSSGTSMYLNSAGVRNTRLRKLKALDRDEVKLARILQAIDEQKVVMLHGYQSHSGKGDCKVEPHRMEPDNKSFQAYDPVRKDMRLFKLSRIADVELLTEKCKNSSKHITRRVDIFGMIESDGHKEEKKRVIMNDFALMLLREEYPSCLNSPLINIEENKGTDRSRYPWMVTFTIFHPAGYLRFLRGLPDDVVEL